MKETIWTHLTNAKFKARYAYNCSYYAGLSDRAYSMILAVGTATTIASWWIWTQYALVWAILAGSAQILQIIKPHLPFISTEKEHLESSYKFERLYLDFERLFKRFNEGKMSKATAEKKLYELRTRVQEIEERHSAYTPSWERLRRISTDETYDALKLNFPTLPPATAAKAPEPEKEQV